MRRTLALLGLMTVLAGIGASSVTAAPSEVKLTIGGQAQFVTPTTLLVPVTVTCPASFVSGFAFVSVSQSSTGANGSGGSPVTCTGNPTTVVIPVTTFGTATFTLGQAAANGFASAGGQFDSDIRRIQIVL